MKSSDMRGKPFRTYAITVCSGIDGLEPADEPLRAAAEIEVALDACACVAAEPPPQHAVAAEPVDRPREGVGIPGRDERAGCLADCGRDCSRIARDDRE